MTLFMNSFKTAGLNLNEKVYHYSPGKKPDLQIEGYGILNSPSL